MATATATATPTATSEGTAIGVVTTTGIQDVSGFLPLLGTAQCEGHVSSALERGFFYAAATPMSIFGSLGIIKAGFTALWISIDKPPWHGPRQLRNAGFFPKGVMGKLAYALDTNDSIYVAEDNLRSILRRYSTINVKLNLRCWPWIRWNLLLSLFTFGFGSIGLTPYVYIIKFDLGRRPFSQSWLYPVLRVYGCVLATVMIQFIIQLRVLVVVHNRLRFQAVNSWFQENGRVPPVSWNTETRAEESLARLASDITSHLKTAHHPDDLQNASGDHRNCQYLHDLEESVVATRSFSSFGVDPRADSNRRTTDLDKLKSICLPSLLLTVCRILLLGGIAAAGVGYIGCFGLIQASNSHNTIGPGTWLAVEVALCIIRLIIWASNPGFDDPPPPISIHKAGRGQTVVYDIGWMLDDVTVDDLHAVVIGINKTADPGIKELELAVSDAQSVVTYLEESLAVPKHQIKFLEDPDSGQINQALENLATDKSIRPGAPIVIYLASHAKGVDYASTLTTESPPTSRLALSVGQSRHALKFLSSEYTREIPDTGLLYSKLLDLIQAIAENKGNNITVILDTCHAGSFGRNAKFDNNASAMNEKSLVLNEEVSSASKRRTIKREEATEVESTMRKETLDGNNELLFDRSQAIAPEREELIAATTSEYLIGYSTHVLLAACSDAQVAREIREGGVFTQYLLTQLKITDTDAVQNLTYRGLIDNLRPQLAKHSQTPVVSGNFQNRLLFNGLLAGKRLGRDTSKETSVISISTDVNMRVEDPERK